MFTFNQEQLDLIKSFISESVIQAVESLKADNRPYLTRRGMAQYLGVSESTVSNWATLGMPVAIIDGRKMYGKKACTNWIKSHENKLETSEKNALKKPVTLTAVK